MELISDVELEARFGMRNRWVGDEDFTDGIRKTYRDGRGIAHLASVVVQHYLEGAGATGARVIGIRVRRESRGIKIFRWGKWPVLRGT